MKKTILASVAATAMVVGTAASAATLNFVGSGGTDNSQVLSNFDIAGVPGLADGTEIAVINGADKNSSNGLFVDGGGEISVTYTYLGSEAGFDNYGAIIGNSPTRTFQNYSDGFASESNVDDVAFGTQLAGAIDLIFQTARDNGPDDQIANQGGASPASENFAIGYFMVNPSYYVLMFDDLTGSNTDRDFDDLVIGVQVSAVPLPASSLLLLAGVGGLAAMKRRKKA